MPRKISVETALRRLHSQEAEVEALRHNSVKDGLYTDYVTCQGTQPGRLSGEGHKKCGYRVPMSKAFKCLYCGFWFCADCAEVHFGKTRAEHAEEMKAKEEKPPRNAEAEIGNGGAIDDDGDMSA